MYDKSIHKKNIEFKFCYIWLHFPNIFDSNDHKANIKISSQYLAFLHNEARNMHACT